MIRPTPRWPGRRLRFIDLLGGAGPARYHEEGGYAMTERNTHLSIVNKDGSTVLLSKCTPIPDVKLCPYCGSNMLRFIGGVPRCDGCRSVFHVRFSRRLRKPPNSLDQKRTRFAEIDGAPSNTSSPDRKPNDPLPPIRTSSRR